MRGACSVGPKGQRGVALLIAILLVALGTILAASIAFQSAMAARRGVATLALDQSLLVAEGAEALAAYALREDYRSGKDVDDQTEQWAKPLGPVEIFPGITLTAAVEDMQGRFNLNSLIGSDAKVDPVAVAELQRLLEMLGLEPKWADQIADWIDPDDVPQPQDGGEDTLYATQNPPYRTPNILITSTSELLALPGFGRDRYLKLAPFVSALPRDATLNVCSAAGATLDALIPNHTEFSLLTPEQMAKNREKGCFPTKTDLLNALQTAIGAADQNTYKAVQDRIDQKSQYFRLTSVVAVGTSEFALYSLLQREASGNVRPIMRSFTRD